LKLLIVIDNRQSARRWLAAAPRLALLGSLINRQAARHWLAAAPRLALLGSLMLAGCSYTFDDTAPDIRLLGSPPNTDGLPRLNHSAAGNDNIVLGYDDNGQQNAYWVAFTENIDTADGKQGAVRAVRLSPPEKEEIILADDVTTTWTRFFLVSRGLDKPMTPPVITVRSAGQTTPPIQFPLPGAPGFFSIGYGEDAFLYWVARATQSTFYTFRSDGSFMRQLKIPPGVDPLNPQLDFYWSSGSKFLLTRAPDGDVLVHSTIESSDVDLGIRPKLLGVIGQSQLIACGADGLRVVRLDGTREQVLDPMPCDDQGDLALRYVEMKTWVYYGTDLQLWRVPLDGNGTPEPVHVDGRRAWQFLDDGRIIVSRTPRELYIQSAGDGWLDGWNFMERGIDVRMSTDKKRLRWLEHAAKANGAGELMSAPIGEAPLHLSLNTRQWEELEDGRILADANHAFRGTQNRVVVIDEASRTAQWVAAAAAQYSRIPYTNDLLVDVVTGPTGLDIVRVPIPPPLPSPAP
jgi:hypothetical protein